MRTPPHRPAGSALGALASALAILAAACGGGHAASGTIVHITEHDFKITAPGRVHAGEVRLRVRNEGPDIHELILVRDPPSGLPLRTDGMTVDEKAIEPEIVGSLEPGAPGTVRELRVRLSPGRYEVLCNMAGHYMGGMHAVLTVS